MSTNARSSQERTAVRPTHIVLGVDTDGASHHYHTPTETVHVVHPDRSREHVEPIAERSVDEWMAFVDERRGWDRRDYGVGLVELAERALSLEGS